MKTKVLDCGHTYVPVPTGAFGAIGYSVDPGGRKICYQCVAALDRQTMIETGHSQNLPLYLTRTQVVVGAGHSSGKVRGGTWEVTDWPGSLRFPVERLSEGKHNIAGTRTDAWFWGPDDHLWHGTQYGEWTQVIHCKRTKEVRR
jgi:hypothetical protein